MSGLVTIATRVLRKAGDTLVRTSHRAGRIEENSAAGVEQLHDIKRHILSSLSEEVSDVFPDHVIVAGDDDSALVGDYGNTPLWLVDVLCGTTNFARELPQYCLNLAIVINKKTEVAAIYSPRYDILYTAVKGAGARCNDRRLRVSTNKQLKNALISWSDADGQSSIGRQCIQQLLSQGIESRVSGCVMLDVASVAAGQLDGAVFEAFNPCQVRAASLLIQEAGGLCSDFAGDNRFNDSGQLVAANPKLFKSLVQNLAPIANQR